MLSVIDQAGACCRHLSPQGTWPSAVPVNLSSVDMCGPGLGPVSSCVVSSSLEALSRPLSLPLVRRVHSKMPCPVHEPVMLSGSVAAEVPQSATCNACTACCRVPGSAPALGLQGASHPVCMLQGSFSHCVCTLQLQTAWHAQCRHFREALSHCAGSLDRRLSSVAAVLRRSCLPLLGMPGQAALSLVCSNEQCGN